MAEKEKRWFGGGFGAWVGPGAEAGFEDVSEGSLAVELDACAEGAGMVGGEGHAGVDGWFIRGWGFRFDEAAEELEEGRLLAASSGEEGAHGN